MRSFQKGFPGSDLMTAAMLSLRLANRMASIEALDLSQSVRFWSDLKRIV